MKEIKRSELRKLIKTKSLREVAKIYGITYERIRQICVMWGIKRRGWNKIKLINDESEPLKIVRKYRDKPRRVKK